MSLTKQFWLAVVAIMTLAFGISFVVSAWSARNYLEDQLRLKNIDNANSLALSMSQMDKDPVMIELMIAAQFDIGHYKSIRLISPKGELIAGRFSDAGADGVPAWFIQLIQLDAAPGIAQVQDGWKQYGTLTVLSHKRYAYQALWDGNRVLLNWFLAGAFLCGALGTLFLRTITRPLDEVVKQAEAIGARRFVTLREPATREFRSVVRAMNTLSDQVRLMLEEESGRLEQLRRDAQLDPLTGLLNREHFLKQTQAVLEDDRALPGGALFILKLPELARLNRELGREATDTLLRHVAEAMQQACPDETCLIGRLNGADFAVLAQGIESPEAMARRLSAQAQLSISDPSAQAEVPLLLGGAGYRHGDALSSVLARADMALARAAEEGGSAIDSGDMALEWKPAPSLMAAWRSLIETAVSLRRIQFATYPVLDAEGRLIHFEAPARMQIIQSELWMPAQEFMPWASRLDMIEAVDEAVFDYALVWLKDNDGPLCINVSSQSVCDPLLTARYYRALKAEPAAAARIWIDIPEIVAYRHAREFRVFCETLKPLGCHIGLEHVGNQICHIGELYDVGLDYLKIDRAIIREVDHSPGNQTFLRGLCTIAHTMGMMTIAEGVNTAEEARVLKELGLKGMTGPGITLA